MEPKNSQSKYMNDDNVETYTRIDDWGDIEFCRDIDLKLRCVSSDKKMLQNIKNDIIEVISDKAFDGICYFERI